MKNEERQAATAVITAGSTKIR